MISARAADIELRNIWRESLGSAVSADLFKGVLGSANLSAEVEQLYKQQPIMGLSTAAVANIREQLGLTSQESLLRNIQIQRELAEAVGIITNPQKLLQEQREIAEAAGIITNPQEFLDTTRLKFNDYKPLSHSETEDDEEPVSDDDSTEQETE